MSAILAGARMIRAPFGCRGAANRYPRIRSRLWSTSPNEPLPGSTPISILVVEDESILALLLRRKLRGWGYAAPEHAITGEEAIERALQIQPHLILMDIRLSGPMDGITAASHIQRYLSIPIIYLTAYVDEETERRAQETNCSAFLTKPFADEVLRTSIQDALNSR